MLQALTSLTDDERDLLADLLKKMGYGSVNAWLFNFTVQATIHPSNLLQDNT